MIKIELDDTGCFSGCTGIIALAGWLTAAVRDAMARAGVLADTAGVALGDVMSISEQGGMAQPQMMEMAASRGGAVPVAGGEVTVQASVTMVFAIGE